MHDPKPTPSRDSETRDTPSRETPAGNGGLPAPANDADRQSTDPAHRRATGVVERDIARRLLSAVTEHATGPEDLDWHLRRCAETVGAITGGDVVAALLDAEGTAFARGEPPDDDTIADNHRQFEWLFNPSRARTALLRALARRPGRTCVVPLNRFGTGASSTSDDLKSPRMTVAGCGWSNRRTHLTLILTPQSPRPTAAQRLAVRLLHAQVAAIVGGTTTDLVEPLRPRLAVTLDHLLTGMSEQEIANAMHRSPHTVHANIKALYRAYGVGSRAALMAKFIGRRPDRRMLRRESPE